MGLSALGALVAIALAFLAQSPRLLNRLNLTGQRLDVRAKSFTGYGLALLLLAMGFFLAGVPLGPEDGATAAGGTADTTALPEGSAGESLAAGATITATVAAGSTGASGQSGAMIGLATPETGGASGAMAGLITQQPTINAGIIVSGTAEIALPPGATTGEPVGTAIPGETPLPTSTSTRVPTATPTSEPSPTPSPTPILVPTARIGDGTSTLPLRRLPGGVVLVVLVRGDTVIPLSGRAFHTGDVWREIQTVDGVIGWVPEQFLDYG